MKVYIDTNILIDLVCLREPFAEQAQKLFALGYIGKLSLITSALSFVNTIYIGRKYNYIDVKDKLNEISVKDNPNNLKSVIFEYVTGKKEIV